MYKDDILTIPANLTGMPAISIPCGVTSKNRPIGLQITGRHFSEAEIYNAAFKFEEKLNLHEELKEIQKELR